MRASQFIQDFGFEKAKDIVDGPLPEGHNKFDLKKNETVEVYKKKFKFVDLRHLKHLVESIDRYNKFESKQEALDAINNAPNGSTHYRKLSCGTRYIKQGARFFEYWNGSQWCRPTVPFTEETHILRFDKLEDLTQAILDYESIYGAKS